MNASPADKILPPPPPLLLLLFVLLLLLLLLLLRLFIPSSALLDNTGKPAAAMNLAPAVLPLQVTSGQVQLSVQCGCLRPAILPLQITSGPVLPSLQCCCLCPAILPLQVTSGPVLPSLQCCCLCPAILPLPSNFRLPGSFSMNFLSRSSSAPVTCSVAMKWICTHGLATCVSSYDDLRG